MSSDFDKFKAAGTSLGLKGNDLLDFITAQQVLKKDEDACIREDRARARSVERETRLHEAKLAEINLEKLKLESGQNVPISAVSHCDHGSKPQPYRDGEDITSYLIRFERIAEMLKWNKVDYAVKLGLLLQGQALKIYASLSPDITNSYESLKSALLEAFRCNNDQYRKEFRNARISPHENYTQFLISLSRMFDFWVKSLDVKTDYESLRHAMIGDQFLASLPTDIRTFVKERNAASPREMAVLADNISSARNCYPKEKTVTIPTQLVSKPLCPKSNAEQYQVKRASSHRELRCFSCGALGHRRSQCPQNPKL